MKMFIWSDRFSYLAVAHADSVTKARDLLLSEMGESGDGSCPERDNARKIILNQTPEIFVGPAAEFALTDSAELREMESYASRMAHENEALRAQVARLTEALNWISAENPKWRRHPDIPSGQGPLEPWQEYVLRLKAVAGCALRATPADALAWLDRERKRAAAEELEQEWEYPFLRAAELRKELEADYKCAPGLTC